MLSLMTNAINGRKTTAPRSWIPISAKYNNDMEEGEEKKYATVYHWLVLRLHIHMNFSWMLVMLNLEADELLHPNRKPKKKVAGKQGSPSSRMLFWQGSWWNMLIFPWMIMPKSCAKRSKTEEAVERYSLS